MKSILVVSKEKDSFPTIRDCFGSEYHIDSASERTEALDMAAKRRYDFIFIDVELLRDPGVNEDYKPGIQPFWNLYSHSELIAMACKERLREAVKAVKSGASDYIAYPLNPEEIKLVVGSLSDYIRMQSELDYLRDKFWQKDSLEITQTKNPAMKAVFEKIRSVAPTRSTVLLTGETGTGKGVLAKLIHQHSTRSDKQFISVHCGAIPETLLESELFGHEKGAFTGAVRRKLGKFEIAHGGTIFLDEVGTLTPSAQIKFLQILQDGTFERVGGEQTLVVDVRVISATNADLKKMVDDGKFRKDLYYRLNVFPVEVPPLSERTEDIPQITDLILKRLNRINQKSISHIAPTVMESLKKYQWPGNIRELENVLERAYVLSTTHFLQEDQFPAEIIFAESTPAKMPFVSSLSLMEVRRRAIETAEKNYLKEILFNNRGKLKDSAEVAGITTRQLHKLMFKHGMHKEDFK